MTLYAKSTIDTDTGALITLLDTPKRKGIMFQIPEIFKTKRYYCATNDKVFQNVRLNRCIALYTSRKDFAGTPNLILVTSKIVPKSMV